MPYVRRVEKTGAGACQVNASNPFIDLCYDFARVIPDLVNCAKGVTVAIVIVAVAFGIRVAVASADTVKGWWK